MQKGENLNKHEASPEDFTRARAVLTLKALEGLKQLCESLSSELLVILGGDLDTYLKVLANVCRQHGPETLQGVLH